jgi:hypothetical protein
MPFRRLSLSRKSSKQSLRENRDETPSVPAVPVGLATKSRPPEASSAGSGATTTSPLDGSVRGKSKSKPPVANNGLAEPFDESSPRKRKTSIA